MIAVDPDCQNQGLGLDLVTFAVDRITELGLPLARDRHRRRPGARPGPPRLRKGRLHPASLGSLLQGTPWRPETALDEDHTTHQGRVRSSDHPAPRRRPMRLPHSSRRISGCRPRPPSV